MNEVARRKPLRYRLDEIEAETAKKVEDNYYQSCITQGWGRWLSGDAIVVHTGGGDCTSYRQMEKDTGRDRRSLKGWHELRLKYPTKKLYLPVIIEDSKKQTVKWLKSQQQKQLDWYQSSESIEWPTPQWLFDRLDEEFHFTLDVCATDKSAKCKKYYTIEDDGLSKDWEGICWMNPPYGKEIADWMAKAKETADNGWTVVCLVPARPDTNWWWDNAIDGEIRFIRGRLKWPGSETMAPFPSAVIVLNKYFDSRVVWWAVKEEI